jgi:hypothetical protein
MRPAQVKGRNRVLAEVDHVAGRQPVAQVGRQKHRRVVVNVDEAGGHSFHTPNQSDLFRRI